MRKASGRRHHDSRSVRAVSVLHCRHVLKLTKSYNAQLSKAKCVTADAKTYEGVVHVCSRVPDKHEMVTVLEITTTGSDSSSNGKLSFVRVVKTMIFTCYANSATTGSS